MKSLARALILLLLPLLALAARADSDSDSDEEVAYENVWSATLLSEFKIITDRYAHDDIGGFFDQYEFTPNKSSSLPTELGIGRLSFDRFGPDQTPQLQLRFTSPTSNLGVSGSQIDDPFFDQHADLFGRFDGLAVDLDYWRLRTEDLRLFPNTQGRQFDDLTRRRDRFYHDRTGFFSEVRVRPAETELGSRDAIRWLAPEISVRGGFEGRDGSQQLRFIQNTSNHWGAVKEPLDQTVGKAGGGILVAPGGLFNLTVDFDYDRFRQDSSTILDSDLGSGFVADDRAVGFIPDTDRLTGTIRMQSRIGERAVLEGGFQVSYLEQVGSSTPRQSSAGLNDNDLLFFSANGAVDVSLTEKISLNAFLKYDQRRNDIQRDTPLFNPVDNGVQVSPFLKRWDRLYAGAETVYSLYRSNVVALGLRYEWIDRNLQFGLPTNLIVLRPNVWVLGDTQMWTIYGRTNLRPYEGLGVRGELGYRGAPDTGYILDLDDYVYGRLRASYRLPIDPLVVLSAFVNGHLGRNHELSATAGLGPMPAGLESKRKFDQKNIAWGLTVTSYPLDRLSVFASYFQSHCDENYDLVLTNLQRYFQNTAPITFSGDGSPDPENKQLSVVVGANLRLGDDTDANLSYSFTRAKLNYESGGEPIQVQDISQNREIDGDIHGVNVGIGHWLREGLRVQLGYRLQLYDDRAPRPNGTGSVVQPVDPSDTRHTITLAVTLTSDLLKDSD